MKIVVFFDPVGVTPPEVQGKTVVVLDLLRATTTITVALYHGAKAVLPAASTEEALRIAQNLERDDVVLAGERKSQRIPGFALGNSPLEFTPDAVRGKTVVMATTNGTPARSTSGMMARAAELQSPSNMATYFFSASIWVTLLTASAGLQRLSWKSISILRPSTPPLALASATASSAPQRECWPKVETPPVSGMEAPIRIGPSWDCANPEWARAPRITAAIIRRILRMLIPPQVCTSTGRTPTTQRGSLPHGEGLPATGGVLSGRVGDGRAGRLGEAGFAFGRHGNRPATATHVLRSAAVRRTA